MPRLLIELAILLFAVAGSGCSGGFSSPRSDSAPDNPSSAVHIPGGSVRIEHVSNLVTVKISFSFAPQHDTVYLGRCGFDANTRLERWVDGHWQFAYSGTCPAIAMQQIVVARDTFADTAIAVESSSANPKSLVPGQYRLVVAAFWHMADANHLWALSDTLALELKASAPFTIE